MDMEWENCDLNVFPVENAPENFFSFFNIQCQSIKQWK